MSELSLKNCRLDGRYDTGEQLGRGSYAEIFLANDELASPQSPHKEVVIKALNVFLQNDLDADLERTLVVNFQNEAIALDRVRHPNIISRLGHGTARDLRGTVFHYLVLEYLSGGDLAKICRRGALPLQKVLKYLEQICAGLGHAHRHGVIHRDIKPQNLLLTADRETVKIADFGVARVTETDSPITRVGTNMFAPPEHSPLLADDENAIVYNELTPAADIYSLAKSVYVLMTGESPRFYSNQMIAELPYAVRQENWAADLLPILKKATRNNPSERYQTVDEFWLDVTKLAKYVVSENGSRATRPEILIDRTPQPHVARGYTPLAPQKPSFNTSRDLKLKNLSIGENAPLVVKIGDEPKKQIDPTLKYPLTRPEPEDKFDPRDSIVAAAPTPPKKKRLKRLVGFLFLIFIFGLILYGTNSYLSGRGILGRFSSPFSTKTGTTNTDLNLRPEPNTGKDPIGMATKNSRVKIISSQNNWYEIEIIKQGRPLDTANSSDHGWINGKYLDID